MSRNFFGPLILIILFSLESYSDSSANYEELRKNFIAEYGPIIFEFSKKNFKIILDDESPNYFGGIRVDETEVTITIGREAHNEPGVTLDAYAAILCHEVGHLLGGAPYKSKSSSDFKSSTEGQSDYFAATTCLPKLISKKMLLSNFEINNLPIGWHKTCKKSRNSLSQCLQVLSAGFNLMNSVHAIYLNYPNPPALPNIDWPEPKGKSANQIYPSLQCRLDTYVHGALGFDQPNCWF